MPATLPAVFVTLVATQHRLPELSGSTTCHQLESPDFPVICALAPTLKPLRTIQPVPGPRRQLTATSFGNATGTVGVEVVVGGGVLDGGSVNVGMIVDVVWVEEGVIAGAVGVSVGRLDGRLQASIARTRARVDNKLRDFITFLLWVVSIILCRNPTDGNSSRGTMQKSLMRSHQGFLPIYASVFST
jgi:hypothetical protein